MNEVLHQELKSVRKRTTETTALEDNTTATAPKPTGSQNTEKIELACLDSIERMNREVSRFKNVLDNMWLKNTDFVYTKENS